MNEVKSQSVSWEFTCDFFHDFKAFDFSGEISMKSREVGFKRLRLPLHSSDERFHTISLSSGFLLRVRRATALHMQTRQRQAQRAHTSGREATTHIRQMSGQSQGRLRPCDVEDGAHRASGKRQQALMTRRRGVRTPLEARSTRNARGDERVLSEGAVLEVACTRRGGGAAAVRAARACLRRGSSAPCEVGAALP